MGDDRWQRRKRLRGSIYSAVRIQRRSKLLGLRYQEMAARTRRETEMVRDDGCPHLSPRRAYFPCATLTTSTRHKLRTALRTALRSTTP